MTHEPGQTLDAVGSPVRRERTAAPPPVAQRNGQWGDVVGAERLPISKVDLSPCG